MKLALAFKVFQGNYGSFHELMRELSGSTLLYLGFLFGVPSPRKALVLRFLPARRADDHSFPPCWLHVKFEKLLATDLVEDFRKSGPQHGPPMWSSSLCRLLVLQARQSINHIHVPSANSHMRGLSVYQDLPSTLK